MPTRDAEAAGQRVLTGGFVGLVEVPGIEPGSFVVLPGLLRAQPALPLLGSGDHAGEFTVTSPVA